MALKGNLKEMRLSDLVQVACKGKNQACLVIQSQDSRASIFFENGQIVHATLDSDEGEEVVYELLTWDDGTFEIEQDVIPPKRTITTNWQGLLLEGMRRVDEHDPRHTESKTVKSEETTVELVNGYHAEGIDKSEQEAKIVAIEEKLEEKLERFKEIEGFMGVGVFSRAGELLAAGKSSMSEMDMVGALVTTMVGNAQKTSEELGLGGTDEIDIVTKEGANIFVRCFSQEKVNFTLILICEKKAQIGIIRLRLNQVLPTLAEDLA
jgi:predicted regulator of Ras-like GTPase activity (Roadblock/LC7/MglB family)